MKRRFKVRVIAKPMPTNPTLPVNLTLPAELNPTVANTMVTTKTLVAKSASMAATSIPVTVYNLAQDKFEGIPYPSRKFQEGEGPSAPAVTIPRESSNLKLQPLS